MKLASPVKLVVLFLTILPLIYISFFFANIAYSASSPSKDDLIFKNFGVFMAIHLSVMLLMFALLAFYIVFLFKTSAVRTDMKALWAIVLFFGGPVAMPIFWYLYIWRDPTIFESSAA
jgi:hypothetical protein